LILRRLPVILRLNPKVQDIRKTYFIPRPTLLRLTHFQYHKRKYQSPRILFSFGISPYLNFYFIFRITLLRLAHFRNTIVFAPRGIGIPLAGLSRGLAEMSLGVDASW
jgi:hypothetical protein